MVESIGEVLDYSNKVKRLPIDTMDSYLRLYLYHVDLSWSARLCNKCRYGT